MSFIFSQALVEASSLASSWGTDASAQSSANHTPKPCLWHDKTMAPSRLSRFGMTCKTLTDDRGAELLMSFVAAFHAKTSAPLAAEQELTESDQACGAKWPASSARYDPASSSWKTAHCLWDEDLQWSSVTLPTWGMTRSGAVYRHPTAERPISATGSGLWRTPNAQVTAAKSTVVKLSGRKPSDPQVGLADQVAAVEREAYQAGQQTPPMRLNPDWVEVLMGWPNEMTSLNPISSVKMCFWLMGFCDDEETGRTQVLRVLREGNAAKEVREAIGRSVCISEAAFLLHELCEYANRPYEARIFMACAEALEEEMRSVRLYEGVTGAPHRPGQDAQRTGKHTDSMQALSRLLAHHGQKAWKNGSWEDGIPRVVNGMAHRSHRLKAIGNGQVPRVAAAAWKLLTEIK